MNDETRLVPVRDEGALTDAEPAAPVPVSVDELTTKVVAALDMIAAIIPDLRTPHPASAKQVRGGRTVSREAVHSIVALVEASPRLQKVTQMDTARAREVLGSADAYRLLGERLDLLRAQVRYTAEARWAEVAAQAMLAYSVASVLADDPTEPELATRVETVRRHLGRRNGATGKRKKEPKPE